MREPKEDHPAEEAEAVAEEEGAGGLGGPPCGAFRELTEHTASSTRPSPDGARRGPPPKVAGPCATSRSDKMGRERQKCCRTSGGCGTSAVPSAPGGSARGWAQGPRSCPRARRESATRSRRRRSLRPGRHLFSASRLPRSPRATSGSASSPARGTRADAMPISVTLEE